MASSKENNPKHLIVIGGATASGKTQLALQIAQHYQAEIISTDSRQFYREMTIGTAKPSQEELQLVPHHFIDSLSVIEEYSVGDFEQHALEKVTALHQHHSVVVAAGGSGLFIHALCHGLDTFPPVLPAVKAQVQHHFDTEGITWLQDMLQQLDPAFYSKVDVHNPARLRRALEVCLSSGQPYSSFLGKNSGNRPFQIHYLLPDWPREVLYSRINQRVDEMIEQGLEQEAQGLRPHAHRTALKTVGYEEWTPYFEGTSPLEEVIDKIKQHSRNYAKRQLTWFRKQSYWTPVPEADATKALEILQSAIL